MGRRIVFDTSKFARSGCLGFPASEEHASLCVVVETGAHHVSVLDGDRFEVIDRFPTPFAVHGGPKFAPDGRFVFVMSRDGWVQKYDLWSLSEVGRVRAGLNSRNIAMSKDGKWLAVANYLPMCLTILSTEDLTVARTFDVASKEDAPSRVSAVYQAPQRDSGHWRKCVCCRGASSWAGSPPPLARVGARQARSDAGSRRHERSNRDSRRRRDRT